MNVQAAIDCGLFTEFVYNKYNAAGTPTDLNGLDVVTSGGAPVIPGKDYKVLATIYANDLATAISPNQPQDFTTIGIVAVNQADPADVYIAVRGTEKIWEWLQDFKFLPRPFPNVSGAGLTEDGFTDMYLSFSLDNGPSQGSFVTDIVSLLPSNAMVTITGHSLGAALATLLALDMAANSSLAVSAYTLASPRVGDLTFSHLFNHVVPNAYRVHNRLDIVPQTPPPPLYFHVGDDTELIPGAALRFDLLCEHHLSSYLNMLATLIGQQAEYPIDADCLNAVTVAATQTEV